MKMLAMALLAGSLNGFADATNSASLTCTTKDGNGTAFKYLDINIQNGKVVDLFIENYQILVNGTQQDDNTIGGEVFDVSVGQPQVTDQETIKLEVSLQDYSDMLHWDITVAPDSHEAAVVWGLQTSDGDSLEHVNGVSLDCTAK
jgi:hypothetical protein